MGWPPYVSSIWFGGVFAIIRLNYLSWSSSYAFKFKDLILWVLIGTILASIFYSLFVGGLLLAIIHSCTLSNNIDELFSDGKIYSDGKLSSDGKFSRDGKLSTNKNPNDAIGNVIYKAVGSNSENGSSTEGSRALVRRGQTSSSISRSGSVTPKGPTSSSGVKLGTYELIRASPLMSKAEDMWLLTSVEGQASRTKGPTTGRHVFKVEGPTSSSVVEPGTSDLVETPKAQGKRLETGPTPSFDMDVALTGHQIHSTILEKSSFNHLSTKYPNHAAGADKGWGYFGNAGGTSMGKPIHDLLTTTVENDRDCLDKFPIPPKKGEPMLACASRFWAKIVNKYDAEYKSVTSDEWPLRHDKVVVDKDQEINTFHNTFISILSETGSKEDQKAACIDIMKTTK